MEARNLGEAALREQLERIIEIIAEGIVVINRDGRFMFANAAAERILGLSRSEIVGKTFGDLKMKVATVDGRRVTEEELHFNAVVRTGKPVYDIEHIHERPDGSTVVVSASAVPLRDTAGNILAVVNSFTDITERKKAEEELRESERRFREMLEKAELVAVMLDIKGRITFINDYLLDLTGWQREDVMGRNWFSIFVPPEQQEELKYFFVKSVAEGEILAHYVNDIVTSWDERRTISFTNVLLRDIQGNIVGTASIGEDITEQQHAAEEVRESRRQVLDILESITDGFVAVDNDWRFTYVNRIAAGLLGQRKEELLFKTIWEAFPELAATRFAKEFRRAVDENTPVVFDEFYPPLDKWFEVHAYPYTTGLSIYFQDVSERKAIDREYKRREQLSDALNDMNALMNSRRDFNETLKQVIADSSRVIGTESALIALRENDRWIVRYVHGLLESLIGTELTGVESQVTALVYKTKKRFVSDDLYNDERLNIEAMRKYSIRSLVAIPLAVKEKVIGVLIFSYHSAPAAFTEPEADFAGKLAASISLALENDRLYAVERQCREYLQGGTA